MKHNLILLTIAITLPSCTDTADHRKEKYKLGNIAVQKTVTGAEYVHQTVDWEAIKRGEKTLEDYFGPVCSSSSKKTSEKNSEEKIQKHEKEKRPESPVLSDEFKKVLAQSSAILQGDAQETKSQVDRALELMMAGKQAQANKLQQEFEAKKAQQVVTFLEGRLQDAAFVDILREAELGKLYAELGCTSQLIPQNSEQAKKYLELGANYGDTRAKSRLKSLQNPHSSFQGVMINW